MEVSIPPHFLCPISLDLMKDPVTLSTGITYDRECIERWIQEGHLTCPVSNQRLPNFDQIPNHFIRKMIQSWCVENKSYGIERIPTPRAPVTPFEVSEMCNRISAAVQRGDRRRCLELVGKVKGLGKESERNRKCIAESGIGGALTLAFEFFSNNGSLEENGGVIEDILSVLVWILSRKAEEQSNLGSLASLQRLACILKKGSLPARRDAVLLLRKLISSSSEVVNKLLLVEGIAEALCRLIKEPISSPVSTATMTIILNLIHTSRRCQTNFVEMGLVQVMVDILVDGDKSICEKALGVLDALCDSQEGRCQAYGNHLIVPVLVHRISVAPDLASELSASILWKLAKNDKRERGVIVDLQELGQRVSLFQMLLVLLQVGCARDSKEKVKELLKLLNIQGASIRCKGSASDGKYLKVPY